MHAGLTKLLENDQLIVWELVLEPGERTGEHRHHMDYLIHVIEGATLRATDANDNVSDVPLQDGDTFHFRVEGDLARAGELATTAVHDAENLGPGRYREIMVEMKRG